MRRIAKALAVLLAAPLLVAAAGRLSPSEALRAAGWTEVAWPGIEPARFEALPDGGLRLTGDGQASFVWRAVERADDCLYWRWRVDAGPPPTPLDRRGGDDRAIMITIGFDGWPPESTLAQRTKQVLAQAVAGDHRLPRSMLVYVWGGTGQEARPFSSPYIQGLSAAYVLRPADTEKGRWFEEKAEVVRDWRTAFRGRTVPPILELAVGGDVDDTRSRLDARVEGLRFGPC